MADGKRIGVAVDFSKCSKKALKWAVDNLTHSGDHLILVTVCPEVFYEEGEMQLWETTGSPLILLSDFANPHIMKKYGVTPDPETLDIVSTASQQKEVIPFNSKSYQFYENFIAIFVYGSKQITVLLKIFWGDAREKICESIDKIPLDSIVIGNRGLGTLKRAIMGSVGNYVVNHATCPVTVVKSYD